jgi:hypothetical protein
MSGTARVGRAALAPVASFCEVKVPPRLALDAGHGAIGDSLVGLSIQGYPNRKAARRTTSDDLNATNGLAAWPLPYGLKAFFAERPVVQADRFEFRHLK